MRDKFSRRGTIGLLGMAALSATGVSAAKNGKKNKGKKEKGSHGSPTDPTLTRFVQEPAGAEVTGLRVTPGGAMFLNAQHPDHGNPAPDSENAIGAVYNFDGASMDIEGMSIQTDADAKTLTVAGDYEHQVLAHGGDDLGDGRKFGVPVDANGDNMDDVMEPECDMNVFVPTSEDETEGYLFTNFEATPGMVGRVNCLGVRVVSITFEHSAGASVSGYWRDHVSPRSAVQTLRRSLKPRGS